MTPKRELGQRQPEGIPVVQRPVAQPAPQSTTRPIHLASDEQRPQRVTR